MVSAKKNEANANNSQTNKDGSIRKRPGRKQKQVRNPSICLIKNPIERNWKDERARIPNDNDATDDEIDDQIFLNENRETSGTELQVIASNSQLTTVRDMNPKLVSSNGSINSVIIASRTREQELANEIKNLRAQLKNNDKSLEKSKSNHFKYRMRLDKFTGAKEDDYDVWWADMQAFFNLYSFSEQEKVNLFNAHLGGEARKFIQDEDITNIDTVAKMDALLKSTFSSKQDWHSILMNIKQKTDEDIRTFSVRLRVAARKCGFKGSSLDTMSVTCLKRGCAPHLSNLLDHCLPHTPYDEIVEHAIQFERKQESNKKPPKRKIEELDMMHDRDDENEDSMASNFKLAKINLVKQNDKNMNQSLQQVKDHLGSKYDKLSQHLGNKYDQLEQTINNLNFGSRVKGHDTDNRYRPYDNKNKDSKVGGYINACLHCAKPNHRFTDCKSASTSQKDAIKRLLREKKFDFKDLIVRSNKFIEERDKRNKFNPGASKPNE